MHGLKQCPSSRTRIIIHIETLTPSCEDRARSIKHRKSAQACRRLEWRRLHLEGGSENDGEVDQHAELEGGKGSDDTWRQGHRER